MIRTHVSHGRCLPQAELLHVEDVAQFYGIGEAAMRKRVNEENDAPGWNKRGRRWVIRKRTFLRWFDEQEGGNKKGGV